MGRGSVFLDVDSISPGQDFAEKIEDALDQSHAVLAVIGDYWNRPKEGGEPPLVDTADFVRQEMERAFRHQLPVIPVLTGKAKMPVEHQLPPSLKPLLRYQAVELRAGRDFKHQLTKLVQAVKRVPPSHTARSGKLRSLSKKQFVWFALTAVAVFSVGYPLFIHDRLEMNHAVRITQTAKLRPGPGTNNMPGTLVVHPGQTATYVDRSFRKYLMIREGGTYFDYWRKVRTADGRDGWIYGAYLEDAERP